MDGRKLAWPWPRFNDTFLRNVSGAFAKRRKALRHLGSFEAHGPDQNDPMEWMTLSLEVPTRRVVVLQLGERNWSNVYIRSNASADRGKILARLEDLRLLDTGDAIVHSFEATVSAVSPTGANWTAEDIDAIWQPVTLTVTPS